MSALQLFSSVTKTPKDQNYDGNSDETDNITLLTVAQLQPVRDLGFAGRAIGVSCPKARQGRKKAAVVRCYQ